MERGMLFWATFALCAGLALVPLWVPEYPPMVDLPQHAGQIAHFERWITGGPHADLFQTNFFTPVMGGYGLAFAVSRLFPAEVTIKLILSGALVGFVFAVLAHVRRSEGSGWWVIPVFATLSGFAFHWGLYNFLVALPIALVLILLGRVAPARAGPWTSIGLAATAVLLFFFHPLAFGFGVLATGLVLLSSLTEPRRRVAGLIALAAPIPVVLFWLSGVQLGVEGSTTPTVWDPGPYRLLQLFGLFGRHETTGALAGAALLLAFPLLDGARPSRRRADWAPLIVCAGLYFAGPLAIMGTGLVYPRFGVLLLPCALIALSGSSSRAPAFGLTRAWKVLAVVLTLGFLAQSTASSIAFSREVPLGPVLDAAPAGQRLLYVPLDPKSPRYAYPVYLHAGAWYAVERGGITDFSFAEFFPVPFRYAQGRGPVLYDFPDQPEMFSWDDFGGERYDLFLVRSATDPAASFFSGAPTAPRLLRADPPWWLYER